MCIATKTRNVVVPTKTSEATPRPPGQQKPRRLQTFSALYFPYNLVESPSPFSSRPDNLELFPQGRVSGKIQLVGERSMLEPKVVLAPVR